MVQFHNRIHDSKTFNGCKAKRSEGKINATNHRDSVMWRPGQLYKTGEPNKDFETVTH